MNAKPHVHNVEIREVFNVLCPGDGLRVIYGDTEVKVWRWFKQKPSPWRLARAVRRAIRKHDKGSIKAGKVENLYDEVRRLLPSEVDQGVWGRDQLARR